jgi:hypothetical protein
MIETIFTFKVKVTSDFNVNRNCVLFKILREMLLEQRWKKDGKTLRMPKLTWRPSSNILIVSSGFPWLYDDESSQDKAASK